MRYFAGECERCGECCRSLIVEAGWLDVMREPVIAIRCQVQDGRGEVPRGEWTWLLAAGYPCPFLGEANRCSIYRTRPNECIAFEPGGAHCRQLRAEAGLAETSAPTTKARRSP